MILSESVEMFCRSEAKRLKASNNAIFAVGSSSSSRGGNDQVRLRQILLRVAGSGPAIMDPIRRKQVKRSQEEAEAEMLAILQSLEADGMKSFQSLLKERLKGYSKELRKKFKEV